MHHSRAIKNIDDSMEEVKITSWEKVDSKLHGWVWGLTKSFVHNVCNVTTDVVEIVRVIKLIVEPESVTEFMQL